MTMSTLKLRPGQPLSPCNGPFNGQARKCILIHSDNINYLLVCAISHIFCYCPLSLPSSTGTNSTNAVSGSGGLGQSQGGSQCLPPNMSAPHQRKGTFTDDLHKLVDNWARDAMNLSQVYHCFMIYATTADIVLT